MRQRVVGGAPNAPTTQLTNAVKRNSQVGAQSPGSAPADLSPAQINFLRRVASPALQSERNLRIPACVTVAQAILESGWGQSRLFTEANNPFGIKNLDLPEDYGEYVARTTEYVNGKPQTTIAHFEKFIDLEDAFFHHSLLFWRAKRYWPAVSVAANWRAFAIRVQHCGYATDSHYAQKLVRLIEDYRLFDHAVLTRWAVEGEA